jgi:Zn-dependent peptidase ImmA (M78 family)/transcriptional regulator with XRE-family HTH domain
VVRSADFHGIPIKKQEEPTMPRKAAAPTPAPTNEVGNLIRRQRQAMQMTVAQLAVRVGVSRNTITNYEAGKTEPNASDLVRLSGALGCAVNDLLCGSGDSFPPRFAFRAHAPLRKDPEIAVAARKYLRAYDEIEEIMDSRLPNRLRKFTAHQKGALSDEFIEMVANTLRHTSGLHDAGPENIVRVLEGLGVRTLFFEHDGKGLEGISTIQGDLKFIMLRNRRKEGKLIERTIFSAAHELGHLVLHPQLFTSEARDDEEDPRRYEKEADKFAGRFLVPTEELVRVWEEEGLGELRLFDALILLKRVFHVSFWCLLFRVVETGLHEEVDMARFIMEVKRRLRIDGTATKDQLEPDQLPPEVLYTTNRFGRLVRSAFLRELIGESKVAELFQVPVNRAKEITADWLRPGYELVDDSDL